ncbi:hypothetical protein H4R34_005447 [Dimargaris verticillata]|uniref:RGS domain-containing protein n=1 Tax=Dimargaris verticillata TaxID=2761393 RepID=A0A9W8E662_9FUNG|nr:hypothetical protein H4R34_005447 [Dimargaris verticillata]
MASPPRWVSRTCSTIASWAKVAVGFQPRTKPQLEQILGNQLCPPLDLESFRYFLIFHERTYENLSFYEFMVAYWIVWSQLAAEEHRLAPPVLGRASNPRQLPAFPKLDITLPTEQPVTLDHIRIGSELKGFEPLWCDQDICRVNMEPCQPHLTVARVKQDTTTEEFKQLLLDYCQGEIPTLGSLAQQHRRQSELHFQRLVTGKQRKSVGLAEGPVEKLRRALTLQDRPLHDVVMAAIEHFFVQGGTEEINITEKTRRQLFEDAAKTTHPSIFEPVYREVVKMLTTTATGNFTRWSVRNISKKEALIRTRSVIPAILVVIVMLVCFIHFEVSRWWRLWTTPFLIFLVVYFITNTRGVCSLHVLGSRFDKRIMTELKAQPKPQAEALKQTRSLTALSQSFAADQASQCSCANEQVRSLLVHFLSDFNQPKPRKSSASTFHTRKTVSEEVSRSSVSTNWSKMEEPLVRKGQMEILLSSPFITFWIVLALEIIFVAIC